MAEPESLVPAVGWIADNKPRIKVVLTTAKSIRWHEAWLSTCPTIPFVYTSDRFTCEGNLIHGFRLLEHYLLSKQWRCKATQEEKVEAGWRIIPREPIGTPNSKTIVAVNWPNGGGKVAGSWVIKEQIQFERLVTLRKSKHKYIIN